MFEFSNQNREQNISTDLKKMSFFKTEHIQKERDILRVGKRKGQRK